MYLVSLPENLLLYHAVSLEEGEREGEEEGEEEKLKNY